MKDDTTLTPEEVANILKITKYTVYEMVKRGELPAYRIGNKIRIDAGDLDTYRKSRKQPEYRTVDSQNSGSSRTTGPITPTMAVDPGSATASLVICGQDPILDILGRHLESHPQGCRVLRQQTGSFAGLLSLYNNRADLAAVHLWDGDSGTYNTPFVRRLVPGIPTILVHLVNRMAGFLVAAGNPKQIKAWEDLARTDIAMVNREPGSGARVLLDEQLFRRGIDRLQITGYNYEELSHLAVASVVARGTADVGLGHEKAALQVRGIDFIPLQQESYDLVIKKEAVSRPHIQAVLDILASTAFQNELSGLGDYDLKDCGKIIK
ncbi:MAG: helix-turn-helix transcriptional regulator [Syntrophomonadaceae bacterium]|nr:helix-turn-helix transcriptional regulator [Syntrophomonadaceae bacterium]